MNINVLIFDGCMGMEVFGLCDTLRMAPPQVSGRTMPRRLKAETRQSPLEYLQGERINMAKRLLEPGSLSVAQITERVGYLDVATFSTLFKRLAGQSPAQYRRGFNTRASAAVISSWSCGHIEKCWRTGAAASWLLKTRLPGSGAAWRTVFAPSNST